MRLCLCVCMCICPYSAEIIAPSIAVMTPINENKLFAFIENLQNLEFPQTCVCMYEVWERILYTNVGGCAIMNMAGSQSVN